MNKLVEAFQSTDSYERKLKLLSISPYSVRKTMQIFQASKYLVQKSKRLTKSHGILPDIQPVSKGKVISKELKENVRNFYKQDDVSRQCAGTKDCVSMWNEVKGVKELIQKRLILMNLKEAYAMYKETPNTLHIGFSTFASLRPKNCILAGSSGTHSVCVCTYHQNAKLQISALGVKDIDYKLLIAKSVCESENKDCMMHVCPKCDRGGVKKFVRQLETFKNNEEFTYKQWVSTDRCTMVQVIESSEDFLESLSNKVNKLTRHHFVAKAQTRFLKHLKSNLQPNEVIILGDFSENYSYIVQDEVQGFHWENSQCTVHPFVAYYRNNSNTELVHASFCFLSPVTKHGTSMVHTFLCTLIPKIKEKCQTVQKVHYFTDGCAAQYKNKNNFSNICYHFADFALNCEWHFFATSHGKSACDGIGGIIKRTVAKASLQRVYNNQILSAEDMYKFCIKHFENKIHFF